MLKRQHDPFPNWTIQEKLDTLSGGAVRKIDVILSLNIDDITETLMNEVKDLFTKKYEDIKELYYEKAQEIMEELDMTNQINQSANQEYETDADGNIIKDAAGNPVPKKGTTKPPGGALGTGGQGAEIPPGNASSPSNAARRIKARKTSQTPISKHTGLKYA